MSKIRCAVLTVSDTAAKDASADKSGPAIQRTLTERGFECTTLTIVPDEVIEIQKVVKDWASRNQFDLILTTGGTGFGVRDKTPEAISILLERPASGIVHLLLSASLKHTPLAALSRPVAGTFHNSLIITLPGSTKAVAENLEALLVGGLLDHAVDLVRGGTGKKVHSALQSGASSTSSHHAHHHHHHHHHGHRIPQPKTALSHDPSLGPSARHRISPFPIVSLKEALGFVMAHTKPLPAEKRIVDLSLRGHVLAEDVHAPENVPRTQTTNVDGYALKLNDKPGVYKVLTSKTHPITQPVPEGHIYRVNTGGPIPNDAEGVLMVEDTKLVKSEGENEEVEVETLAQISQGENVRAPGSDVKQGDLALESGTLITSAGGEVGTLAFVGRKEVQAYKKPVVAILSTGNEILDLQNPNPLNGSDWGGIWDTNRPSLHAALVGLGYEVVDLGVVPDEIDAHVEAIRRGLQADIIITTGGTSMGPTDMLKPVIERHFNGTIHFGRTAIKPGKPTTFASIPVGDQTKPMFALPGNPASALVTFYVFVVPALRKLGGWKDEKCHLPRIKVKLQTAMNLDPRTEFHRSIIVATSEGLKAYSTGGQRSSRVASLAGANGLVIVPPREEGGASRLEIGSDADAILIGEVQSDI